MPNYTEYDGLVEIKIEEKSTKTEDIKLNVDIFTLHVPCSSFAKKKKYFTTKVLWRRFAKNAEKA